MGIYGVCFLLDLLAFIWVLFWPDFMVTSLRYDRWFMVENSNFILHYSYIRTLLFPLNYKKYSIPFFSVLGKLVSEDIC